jgi:hypothetical protein
MSPAPFRDACGITAGATLSDVAIPWADLSDLVARALDPSRMATFGALDLELDGVAILIIWRPPGDPDLVLVASTRDIRTFA